MPKKIQNYISKLRRSSNPQINFTSSKNWIFSACKHPKTLSVDVDHHGNEARDQSHQHSKNNGAASLSDVDRFLFENFKSLYVRDEDNEEETESNAESVREMEAHHPILEPILFESPRLDLGLPPDLRGSNRFFVTPGLSGSLVEDAAWLSATTTCDDEAGSWSSSTTTLNDDPDLCFNHRGSPAVETLPLDFIAILMYSPNPYEDFLRSMQDMVEARLKNQERVDWDFMEELLFYYLNLNEKKSHKFILRAFVDVISGLRRGSEAVQATLPRRVRTVKIGRLSRRWGLKK